MKCYPIWLLTLLLIGCASAAPAAPAPTAPPTAAPRTDPVDTAANFLLDLGRAVANQNLIDPDTRGQLADGLASYFLQAERAGQRQAFAAALGNLARGLEQRQQTGRQPLTVSIEPTKRDEMRFSSASAAGDRAIVRPINVQLVLSYGPNGETKVATDLTQLIGRNDLPLIWDGVRWYLTED